MRTIALALLMLIVGQSISAEPIVTVKDKVFGEWTERSVDCGTLWKHPDEGLTYLTCQFGRQVHGSRVCQEVEEIPVPEDTDQAVEYLSEVMTDMLRHYAKRHNACGFYAGTLAEKSGQNPDIMFGQKWRENTFCPLNDAFQACQKASQE